MEGHMIIYAEEKRFGSLPLKKSLMQTAGNGPHNDMYGSRINGSQSSQRAVIPATLDWDRRQCLTAAPTVKGLRNKQKSSHRREFQFSIAFRIPVKGKPGAELPVADVVCLRLRI